MRTMRYLTPVDSAAASSIVTSADGALVFKAGGLDVLDLWKEGLTQRAEGVVNLLNLSNLRFIRAETAGATLGSLSTLAEIAAHEDLIHDYAALAQAAGAAATPQLRNVATLGGNLCQRPRCWYFRNAEFACLKKGGATCFAVEGDNRYHAVFGGGPCHIVHPSATASALSALDAAVRVRGANGERTVPIAEFFVRPDQDLYHENSLKAGELVTEVSIPKPAAGRVSAYLKIKEKQSHDWPLAEAAVALTLTGGRIRDPRVVLGHAAPVPWRSKEAEKVLEGAAPDEKTFKAAGEAAMKPAQPMSGNAYKVKILAVAVARSLALAARGGGRA